MICQFLFTLHIESDPTKVGETDTRQPPYATSACQSVEPVSRKRTCKVGPGRFIPRCRRIKIGLVAARELNKINAHNLFVFYSCKMLRKDLAQMPLLGNVAEFKKIPTLHQDQCKESSSNEHKGVHLHTLVDRDVEALQERG